ncbi:MAG: Nif3-like dinuclear metal center hexameric protein [archaeon]
MDAPPVYAQLDKDFIKQGMHDDWFPYMESIAEFISDSFKKTSMGLVCDFAKDITRVYTAVFPSATVMQFLIDKDAHDALLFLHHPAVWDIRKAPDVFEQMRPDLLQQFKDKRIAIYTLHVPLDDYGAYSTSVTLAKALGILPEKAFAPYYGALAGVFGKTAATTVHDLQNIFSEAVHHAVSLYAYGSAAIADGRVAVVAGGGNDIEMLQEIAQVGITTFVTGITAKNSHSQAAHDFAKAHGINLLGGTHYSTERFACQAMCSYFSKMGLPAEFIPDIPVMEDE